MHLKDEQQMIRDMVREFAASEVEPLAHGIDAAARFPAELVGKLAELNLLGLTVPEEYGGAGVDTLSCCLVIEELARASASVAMVVAAHNLLALPAVAQAAPKRIRELATGACIGAFAAQEPAQVAGQEWAATRAQAAGDGFGLDGKKIGVTNGTAAGVFVVSAVDAGGEPELFLVEREAAGVDVQALEQTGLRGSGAADVGFRDVRLPALARLARGTAAAALVETLHGNGWLGIAAVSLGIAQAAFDRAARYARQREQFDRPIATFAAIQWKLADMDAAIHAARLALYDAAKCHGSDHVAPYEAGRARVLASAAAMLAADHAVQIHGGYGYCTEYHVERHYRDATLCEIVWETTDAQRLAVGRELLRQLDGGAVVRT
jgi:alkylation response protein AidB-like acyl-CoA dehydrogenase